jgi:hypothetical protein
LIYSLLQWEALALLLIGISVNQLRSLPEGTTALGLPVTMGAYLYTFIFVSNVCHLFLWCVDYYHATSAFSSKIFFYLLNFNLGNILQVTVPSMASVYNEYALKSQYDTSIYLQVKYAELGIK